MNDLEFAGAAVLHTGRDGIALIKRFEGCRLSAYQDQVGIWTIGWGDTKGVTPGMRITQAEADRRLADRLAREFEPGVLRALGGAPVTQLQFDAMISLEWNIGIGRLDDPRTPENEGSGFGGSSVARLHRQGRYTEAAAAFLLWDKVKGKYSQPHHDRREAARALYLSGMPELAGTLAGMPPLPEAAGDAAPPASTASPALAIIGHGSPKPLVKAAQNALIAAGFGPQLGPRQDDGDYGGLTAGAVHAFQAKVGLPVGPLDAATWAKLGPA